MAQKVSKYSFEDVEKRLDAIKFDQGGEKFLAGDGTYKEVTGSGGISSNSGVKSIEAITQAAYDALPRPRDASILYVIRG